MVKLNRIYTRTGDDGLTGLVGGARVSKSNVRVEAYGSVDEANAAVGHADSCAAPDDPRMSVMLRSIQNDLFDVGADLATPIASDEAEGAALRVLPAQVDRLETIIDEHNASLEPLTSFVLPGGSELASRLHVARTAVRRAERAVVTLMAEEPRATSGECLRYLNRLSDLLFVLARTANDLGKSDVLWVPGSNRGEG